MLELDKLGMADPERQRFERAIRQSYGAVLVTGPTGSGKSTSLYAALGLVNTPEKNIITIEDPVEYQVPGITQVQVNPQGRPDLRQGPALHDARGPRHHHGRRDPRRGDGADRRRGGAHGPPRALDAPHERRAQRRHAPDRDGDRAVPGPSSAVDCVVAQRLARTLCTQCKRRTIIPSHVLRDHGYPAHVDLEAYEPVGCARCSGSGYKGRLGLYEVMALTDEVRQLVVERAGADRIAEVAVRQGMRRLRDDGLQKVHEGRTSIAEIARVVGTGVVVDI